VLFRSHIDGSQHLFTPELVMRVQEKLGADIIMCLDECVPAGTYRYGFATPYACERSACGTYLYGVVEVTRALDPGCLPSAGNAAPSPVAPVGWTEDDLICGYDGPGYYGSWGRAVAGGCGCGTASAGVLGVDGLAAAGGLALLRRRRTARR
jgi:hypothetical protein